jgi:NADH-quinone oxidoreductase subunit H
MYLTIYDFNRLFESINGWLIATFGESLAAVIAYVLIGVSAIMFVALLGLSLVYAERKVAAWFQQRIGPNRVGFQGVMQTAADITKLIMKEPLTAGNSDKFLYNLAPFIMMLAPFIVISALPFAKGLHVMDLNVGVLFVTAVSSIGVLGILISGWSSNNKYSLIGAMRSGAQVVSYELSAGLSLMVIIIMSGSLQFSEIIASQADGWWIFKGHLPVWIAFIIFLIAGTAETNRGPFDLAEAESELTAGFHTEYSGIKFAFFFLAEYVNLFIIVSIAATLFLGGWMPLHIGNWEAFNNVMDMIPSVIWFIGKVSFLILLLMWFRWTFPRLRIDQLLTLEWKYLLPISLVNIVFAAFVTLMGWTL